MGADQSSAQLKSQRDEDIPYTSYSISKPIDGEPARSSPRLPTKSRSPQPKDSAKEPSRKHDIVVVAEGQKQQQVDTEMVKLSSIPVFVPIMRGPLNVPHIPDQEMLDRLDTRQVLKLCARYQEHMRQCAEAVAFDQNALCVRVKEVDYQIQTLYAHLTERQKKFAKYAEQIKKVGEMQTALNKVKMSVEQTLPIMERLNSVLPDDDQLEPFSMSAAAQKSVN